MTLMLTINIMKLEVNSISNIGSLNIGKSIICQNRAVSKEITNGGTEAGATGEGDETGGAAVTPPASSGITPLHTIPPVPAVPPTTPPVAPSVTQPVTPS